jgi:hypothetical protein
VGDIIKYAMKLLQAPVWNSALENMNDHLEHSLGATFSADVGAATPVDVVAALAPDLKRNLTNILVDSVPAAVTAPLVAALTATLAPPAAAAAAARAGADLSQSLAASLHDALSLRLGATLPAALHRSLRAGLVPALTRALTHALVPSLAHALGGHAAPPAAGGAAAPPGPPAPRWAPRVAADVDVALRDGVEACVTRAGGQGAGAGATVDASANGARLECWAALAADREYASLYRSHAAAEYYGGYQARYYDAVVTALDAEQNTL